MAMIPVSVKMEDKRGQFLVGNIVGHPPTSPARSGNNPKDGEDEEPDVRVLQQREPLITGHFDIAFLSR